MRIRIRILVAAVVCLIAGGIWATASLRDDSSILSLVTRELRDYAKYQMCWSDANGFCVLKKMANYEKKGRYDDAISSGLAWTEKHPDGIDSQWIYRDLTFLYLKKASLDDEHKEGYVDQALLYRDRLLPSSSDSAGALEPLETISEYAGNISTAQKCVQYRNSIKFLDRMNSLVTQDKERLAREFKPDPKEQRETQCLSDWIGATTERVNKKLTSSNCVQ